MEKGQLFASRYILLHEEKEGGTAIIFRAFDQERNQLVALKIFNENKLSNGVLNEIWHRESTALSKLQHPNIVTFISAGRCPDTGKRYIALEWFDGETLDDVLNNQVSMGFDRFSTLYGDYILSALSHAAESGIIHRDISPKNILVGKETEIKVIDFGQAKLEQIAIGLTVAGYATPPYCPPEPDTGQYTGTRDAFSFCAIAVRAMSGERLNNHDDLYTQYETLNKAGECPDPFSLALSRDPADRPDNIIAFREILSGGISSDESPEVYRLYIRLSGEVEQDIGYLGEGEESGRSLLLRELNETATISSPKNGSINKRFALETRSFRVMADLDSRTELVIVVIGVQKRLMHFSMLWRSQSWQPSLTFIDKFPVTPKEKTNAQEELEAFYLGYERFINSLELKNKKSDDQVFMAWGRLLDAMTDIEKNRVPLLTFSKPSISDNRLEVELGGVDGAEIGQLRIIFDHGKQVFKGEIVSIRGSQCVLVSKAPFISEDEIPRRGTLENDWYMARVSIRRQRGALEKFKSGELVNPRLSSYATLSEIGTDDLSLASNVRYFNKHLGDEKKVLVSRFLAMNDILLVQGPPGTGKTTLIVEIIRQFLDGDPARRILLVSQTHVALDHALSEVLSKDSNVKVVRIGSGSYELKDSVRSCSIEYRGRALQKMVQKQAREYVIREANMLNVDIKEIQQGIDSVEVLRCRKLVNDAESEIAKIEREMKQLNTSTEKGTGGVTTMDLDSIKSRMRTLEDQLFEYRERQKRVQAELRLANSRLAESGEDGKELVKLDDDSLDEWCDELLKGDKKEKIRKLVETAEEWRVQFGQSDDFKTAIIADSAIVAGTCVGFSREKAAAISEFDLCIVDEASKATTTELLVPISQAKKVVLVGDHHQLPAVIDYALKDSGLKEEYSIDDEQLEIQLFEALYKKLRDGLKVSLITQFRMRKEIGDLISSCFYDDELKTSPDVKRRPVTDLALSGIDHALTWFDTKSETGDRSWEKKHGKSFYNPHEGECVINTLKKIAFVLRSSKLEEPPTVGVISGYAEQVKHLQRRIDSESGLGSLDIECSSVHQFQGREVDICIYSITRDNANGEVGFLSDWRLLNVALSRAREFLVIIGSTSFCSGAKSAPHFPNLVRYFQDNHPERIKDWVDG